MADEPTQETSVIVVSPDANALVETKTPKQEDELKQETDALIEAIKKRAQAEIQAAGDLTRETYLNAVRRAREAIEQNRLIEPDRIEHSVQQIQHEAEKNWHGVLSEIESLGVRLADAAKAAWTTFNGPK